MDHTGYLGVVAFDTAEVYSDADPVNGLNGAQASAFDLTNGFGWTAGAYVDRGSYFGIRAYDNFESYSDAASVNGLNGATGVADSGTGYGWNNGAYVDR